MPITRHQPECYSAWLHRHCAGEWDMRIDHPHPEGETVTYCFQRSEDYENFKTMLLEDTMT